MLDNVQGEAMLGDERFGGARQGFYNLKVRCGLQRCGLARNCWAGQGILCSWHGLDLVMQGWVGRGTDRYGKDKYSKGGLQ